MDEPRKGCATCQHFSKPDPASTRCEHAELTYMEGSPGVSRGYDPSRGGEDCGLYALAGELVVVRYRQAHNQCHYCAWPVGTCGH